MSDAGRAGGVEEAVPSGALLGAAARGAEPRGGASPGGQQAFTYPATLLAVIDGDTVKLSIRLRRSTAAKRSLGFHVYYEDGWLTVHESLRLVGLNAAEKTTAAGVLARMYAVSWFAAAGPVVMVSTVRDRQEKYGRFLATVTTRAGRDLNADLLSTGHALVWDGAGKRPV